MAPWNRSFSSRGSGSGDAIIEISDDDPKANSVSRPSGSQGMGIPAIGYFPFWAVTSFTFLHVGFCALDKTQLSNTVLPVVMSLFKHFLAIIACCSSNYGLLTRLQEQHSWFWFDLFPVLFANTSREDTRPWESVPYRLFDSLTRQWQLHFLRNMSSFAHWFLVMTFLFLPSLWFQWYYLIFVVINFIFIGRTDMIRRQKMGIGIHLAAETSLFFAMTGKNTKFFPSLVVFVSFSISAIVREQVIRLQRLQEGQRQQLRAMHQKLQFSSRDFAGLTEDDICQLTPVTSIKDNIALLLNSENKWVKVVEFPVGVMGAILFQHFFKLTSFNEVLAFLYLAMMWVANLALVGVSSDCGVLYFLLSNVVMGTTVNQFDLRIKTWFAFGASFVLYVFRIMLEFLILRENKMQIREGFFRRCKRIRQYFK